MKTVLIIAVVALAGFAQQTPPGGQGRGGGRGGVQAPPPVPNLSLRQVFEFAKAINVPMIITNADASSLADLDKLAGEFGVDVALESGKDPKALISALQGRSKHMGVAADLGGWAQEGIKPVDGLA